MDISGSVTIAEPDPGWQQAYNRQRDLIVQIFGPQLLQIHHVGSTALRSVAARPIIDILVEVISLDSLEALESTWKKHKFEASAATWGIHHAMLIRKAPYEPTHIHILERGDPQIQQWLELQNYFKQHPQVCALYSRLKKTASIESKGNILTYELQKQRFLQQVFVKSCSLWQAPEAPKKGLNRFMSIEVVAKRAWDSFCLFYQTLFRYSPLCQPIPYPGILAWQSKLSHEQFSPLWRFTLDENDFSNAFRFLLKAFETAPASRSAWISPFDPIKVQTHLSSLGFNPAENYQIMLLPLFQFQVYDKSPRAFKRILHSQELYGWASLLREQSQISEWFELYTSLPSQLYAFGQSFEFYTLEDHGAVVGSCLLFYHLETITIVELRWKNDDHLKDILNMTIQRAHALNYPYILIPIESNRSPPLKKYGCAPLFDFKQWKSLRSEEIF